MYFIVIVIVSVYFCIVLLICETNSIQFKIRFTYFHCGNFYWGLFIARSPGEQYGNIPRVVTARVYYVLSGSLMSPLLIK